MDQQKPYWDKCRTCGHPIGHRTLYWTCSVSTCNKKSNPLVFCSVDCWDIHAPVMNHKNAGAEENISPQPLVDDQTERAPRRKIVSSGPSHSLEEVENNSEDPGQEILIVASKLKHYIKARSGGMNTSASVMDRLSDLVRELADKAISHARQDGRKTVMDKDFR